MNSLSVRLRQAVCQHDSIAVDRIDHEVRSIVAELLATNSDDTVQLLEALRALYSTLLDTVSSERARVAGELGDLARGRRGVSAYQSH
jgi:hypothetical protein